MALFLYILLCLIWGSTWLAIKIGVSQAPPFYAAGLRFVVAVALLSAIALVRGYRYPRSLTRILALGYPGIFMYGASYALVYLAERDINSGTTAVLFAAFPFFVAALAWLMYRSERLGWLGWAGMMIGFAGVVLISYDSVQISAQVFTSSLLAIGAPLVSAYGIVIHKHRFASENIVVAANIQMIFGGVLLLAAALIFESWGQIQWTGASVGSILFLAVFGTVVAFLGYYWLVARLPVTTVSLVAFITPLIAVLIGIAAAEETFTAATVAGAALTLAGVLLTIWPRAARVRI